MSGEAIENEILMAVRTQIPDPPPPLLTLREGAANPGVLSFQNLNLYRAMRNEFLQRAGASMWTRPDMTYRFVETKVREMLKEGWEGYSLVDNESPETVLVMLDNKIHGFSPQSNTLYSDELRNQLMTPTFPHDCLKDLFCMSASSFFWNLYVDPYVKEDLNEEDWMVIGNAFLFAQWKEDLECRILLPLLNDISYGHDLLERLESFLHFPVQTDMWTNSSIYGMDALYALLQNANHGGRDSLPLTVVKDILTWSPWAHLIPVIQALTRVKHQAVSHAKARIHSDSCRLYVEWLYFSFPRTQYDAQDYARCMAMQSHSDKRMLEWRFRLAIMARLILPRSPSPTQKQCEALKRYALQLTVQDDFAIDFTASGAKHLGLLAEQVLRNAPKLKQLMMEAQPALSEVTADYLSGVWQDVWLKVFHSPVLRTLVLVTLAGRGGLFLSAQKRVMDALLQVVRRTLQAVW